MSVSKLPPNLNNPKSLLYEVADNNPDIENVIVLMQTADGNFKMVANQYDPGFLAVAAITLNGLAQEIIWSAAGEGEI